MLKIGDKVKTTDIETKDPGKYKYHIATVKVKRSTRKINIEALELINQ